MQLFPNPFDLRLYVDLRHFIEHRKNIAILGRLKTKEIFEILGVSFKLTSLVKTFSSLTKESWGMTPEIQQSHQGSEDREEVPSHSWNDPVL